MTAPKPESTALARTGEQAGESAGAMQKFKEYGTLNTAALAEVRRAREVREVADLVSMTKFSRLQEHQQVALAKWCIKRDVDPVTELNDLGGPYVNSAWSIRKLGELRVRGIVANVEQYNIAADERLAALAKDTSAPTDVREEAAREHYLRLRRRIEHNVPEEAAACVLTLIYLAAGGAPIEGVKWGGNGTSHRTPKSGGEMILNPVVEENPELSVESQSVRRAMRNLILRVPEALPELVNDKGEPELQAPKELRVRSTPAKPPAEAERRELSITQHSGYDVDPTNVRDAEGNNIVKETVVTGDAARAAFDAEAAELLDEDRELAMREAKAFAEQEELAITRAPIKPRDALREG